MRVYMGIGVPGCGKTTLLKPLAEKLGVVYINPDDIRAELTGDATNHTKEAQVWREVHRRTAKALTDAGAVVDATFTRARDRKKIIEIARQAGVQAIVAYWFNVPLEVCLERNKGRTRIVPEDIIHTMHERLLRTPPTFEEGFAEIIEITD